MQDAHLRASCCAEIAQHDASNSKFASQPERSNLSISQTLSVESGSCRPVTFTRVDRTPGRSKRGKKDSIRDEAYLDELEALFVTLRAQGTSVRDAIWAVAGTDRERRHKRYDGRQSADARRLLLMVCEERGLTVDDIVKRTKDRYVVASRWIAMRVLQGAGFSTALISTMLGIDHAAVLYGVRQSGNRLDLLAVVNQIGRMLEEPTAVVA